MITKRKLTSQSIGELTNVYPKAAMRSSGGSTRSGMGSQSSPFSWDEYNAYLDGKVSCDNSGEVYYYDQSGDLQSSSTIVIDEIVVNGNNSGSSGFSGLSFYDRMWSNMYHGTTGDVHDTPPTGSTDGSQGGGGSGNSNSRFTAVDLMDKSKFVAYRVSGDCMKGAKAIMKNYNLVADFSGRVEFVKATGVAAPYIVSNAMKIADACFVAGQPFVAGVRNTGSPDKNVGQHANHFVVITGRGSDSRGMYYIYMETGVTPVDDGCDTTKNRFYYNQTTKRWEDERLSIGQNKFGYLTEFRPNN